MERDNEIGSNVLVHTVSRPLGVELIHLHDYRMNGRKYDIVINKVNDISLLSTESTNSEGGSGYQVIAIDDMENSYAVFVPQIFAESLYQCDEADQSTSYSGSTSESLVGSILRHLKLIQDRSNISTLVCEDSPARSRYKGHKTVTKNEESTSLRGRKMRCNKKHSKRIFISAAERDSRILRVRIATLRTLQALSALKRSTELGEESPGEYDHDDLRYDDIVTSRHTGVERSQQVNKQGRAPIRMSLRKNSEACLLHRMARAGESLLWRTEIVKPHFHKSNYYAVLLMQEDDENIEQDVKCSLQVHNSTERNTNHVRASRSSPEKRHKYKDLEKRRERGRKVRFSLRQSSDGLSVSRPIVDVLKGDIDQDNTLKEQGKKNTDCQPQHSFFGDNAWGEATENVQYSQDAVERTKTKTLSATQLRVHSTGSGSAYSAELQGCLRNGEGTIDECSMQTESTKPQFDFSYRHGDESTFESLKIAPEPAQRRSFTESDLHPTISRDCWTSLSAEPLASITTHAGEAAKIIADNVPAHIAFRGNGLGRPKMITVERESLQHRYQSKWTSWCLENQVTRKTSTLQLEEFVLRYPDRKSLLVKLGIRYAHALETSLASIQLLKHASFAEDGVDMNVLGKKYGSAHLKWLGIAHFNLFLKEVKLNARAHFHLRKSLSALSQAFAYFANVADLKLMFRYAVCLFWQPYTRDQVQHLENASIILEELKKNRKSIQEADLIAVLFLHYQVLVRLDRMPQALIYIQQIIDMKYGEIHPNELFINRKKQAKLISPSELEYHISDYRLMMTYCAKKCGDDMDENYTLRSDSIPKPSMGTTKEEEWVLWWKLADKCFRNEDFALAAVFYDTALPLTADETDKGVLHYNKAMCHQSFQDISRYKESLSIARSFIPDMKIPNFGSSEKEALIFEQLLQQPIADIIHQTRAIVFNPAAAKLQRIYREKTRQKAPAEEIITYIKEAVVRRNGAKACDKHMEMFTVKQEAAFAALQELQAIQSNTTLPALTTTTMDNSKNGIRDLRGTENASARIHSFQPTHPTAESMSQLRKYWEKVLDISLELFESNVTMKRSIAKVKGVMPYISDAAAFCALADSYGLVELAISKLDNPSYWHTIMLVCSTLEVAKKLNDETSPKSSSNSKLTKKPHHLPSIRPAVSPE